MLKRMCRAVGLGGASALLIPLFLSTPAQGQRIPDLQGVYDVATMTPLERPAQFNGRAELTDAEARAMEDYETRRKDREAAPDDPTRAAPPVGGDTSPTNSYLEQVFRAGGGTV